MSPTATSFPSIGASRGAPAAGASIRRQAMVLLALAAAVFSFQLVLGRLADPLADRPWQAAVVMLPLVVVSWLLGRHLHRDRRVLLGGGFLTFFLCYCLLFSVAAGSGLLCGERKLIVGFEDELPRNWLGLSRLGDWRYLLVPRAPAEHDLLVVTPPSFVSMSRDTVRLRLAAMIDQAIQKKAKGIAFDYYLGESSTLMDPFLCAALKRAREKELPVLFGYLHQEVNLHEVDGPGLVNTAPPPAMLEECLGKNLASTAGYREADGRVRSVPLYLRGDEGIESLSFKIARILRPGLEPPAARLIQFTRPRTDPAVLPGWPSDKTWNLFRDHFVLVGSDEPDDTHATPYGPLPGVMIHAYAAQSLRTGHSIRRLETYWYFPSIFCLCFVLTVLQARGVGRWPLVGAALLLSLAVVAASAMAIRYGLVWADVSYPLAAIWPLTLLLMGGGVLQGSRKKRRRALAGLGRTGFGETAVERGQLAPAPAGRDTARPRHFDVFLSHNGSDKPIVRRLAKALESRDLRVWLDEWELRPGQPWQEALEEILRQVEAAAVLIGEDGLGPWEIEEMRVCLSEGVKRDMVILPILLPGAPGSPEVPPFLARFTWVDLRAGLTDDGLDRICWGITGIKPGSPAAALARAA